MTADELLRDLDDARARTLQLVADLAGEQWIGPEFEEVNPPLWEIGHVAWFTERWVLRHLLGRPPLLEGADDVYDSSAVEHWSRWRKILPPVERALRYLREQHDAVKALLTGAVDERLADTVRLSTFHEDMHGEALIYTRQTLGYRAPALDAVVAPAIGGPCPGDVQFAGGTFELGAARTVAPATRRFVFDNEKWAHPVLVAPFALARAPVTEGEFAAFVGDDGYVREEFWCADGRDWRERVRASGPVYWRRDGGGWLVREFDAWRPLQPHRAMLHVNWYEANAWCRWARRRLPSEAEWEFAACNGAVAAAGKPRHPWGDAAIDVEARASLDARALAAAEVAAFAAGDTATGLRQMHGNVWEWTASPFTPFPDFDPDVYRDYSMPWFHTRKVLRGGCFATRGRMLTTTHRNFFKPDRRDLFAGFRTAMDGG